MKKSTLRTGTVAALLTGSVLLLSAAPASADPGSLGSGGSSGSSGSLGSTGSISSGSAALPIPSPAGLIAAGSGEHSDRKALPVGAASGRTRGTAPGWCNGRFGRPAVNLPRTSQQQANVGQPVPRWALAPGDVITFYPGATHVGIYAGFGMVFNAYGVGVPTGLTPLADLPINNIRRF